MKKSLKISFLAMALGAVAICGCNSNNSVPDYNVLSSSTMVTGFHLMDDDNVARNLDSVYFTIDLVQSRIFNADSLPYGTNITRLIPVITTDNASIAELTVSRAGKADTIINYVTNSTDSIDFSYAPVELRIVSQDGKASQTYTIEVNVHKVQSDSLLWNRMERTSLPSTFRVPHQQATARTATTTYCLTSQADQYCMASCTNPASTPWTTQEIALAFTPDFNTLRATAQALFVLDTEGNMYTSTDGLAWSPTGQQWHYIYGAYDNTLIGSKKIDGTWCRVTYPESTPQPIEKDFPISGTSIPIQYVFEMSTSPIITMVGGRTSTGAIVGATWAFDGTSWASLSTRPLPNLENMVLVPYFTITRGNNWVMTRYSTLFAMCGNDANGVNNKTIYISRDYGMNWHKAGHLLQMPATFPAMTCAQGYVYEDTLGENTTAAPAAALGWSRIEMPTLPAGAIYLPSRHRVKSLDTTWQCPYIYLFGGRSAEGVTYNTVWRGAITQFTFKPIQ